MPPLPTRFLTRCHRLEIAETGGGGPRAGVLLHPARRLSFAPTHFLRVSQFFSTAPGVLRLAGNINNASSSPDRRPAGLTAGPQLQGDLHGGATCKLQRERRRHYPVPAIDR